MIVSSIRKFWNNSSNSMQGKLKSSSNILSVCLRSWSWSYEAIQALKYWLIYLKLNFPYQRMPELISQRYEAYVRQMILIYNELLILIVFIHLGQRSACNMKKKKKLQIWLNTITSKRKNIFRGMIQTSCSTYCCNSN